MYREKICVYTVNTVYKCLKTAQIKGFCVIIFVNNQNKNVYKKGKFKMYAILVQKTKDMRTANFHIEDIALTSTRNLICFLEYGYSNPYSLIGVTETFEEANRYIEAVKKDYNKRFKNKI